MELEEGGGGALVVEGGGEGGGSMGETKRRASASSEWKQPVAGSEMRTNSLLGLERWCWRKEVAASGLGGGGKRVVAALGA